MFAALQTGLCTMVDGQDPNRFRAWNIPPLDVYRDYNLKAGPLYFDLRGELTVEYNSNINYSSINPIDDVILRPQVTVGAIWEFTELNALALDLGLGYEKYLENSELDSLDNFLLLSPESELKLNVSVGNLSLQFFEGLSYSTDAADSVGLDGAGNPVFSLAQYGRFTNRAGVRGYYALNIVDLTLEAQRRDVIPDTGSFDFRQSREYLFRVNAQRDLAANLAGGVGGSFSDIGYDGDYLNDGTSWSFGPFLEWAISEYVTLSGGVNWVRGTFDRGGANGDTSDLDSLSGSLVVTHELNRYYRHSLQLSRSQDYGFVSNSREVDMAQYRFDVTPFTDWRFTGNLRWERGRESGGDLRETFDRFGAQLSTRRQLGPRLFVVLSGSYVNKDSIVADRSYDGWKAVCSLTYDF